MIVRRTVRCFVAAWALALASLAFVSPAHAGISPEFQALLNDIAGDFKDVGAELRGCDPTALSIAQEAMKRRMLMNIVAGPVVIGAFENVCKPVLDLFGLGVVGTAYSVTKCAFEYLDSTTDTKGFGLCLLAEGVSAAVGKAFEAMDVNSTVAAGLNVPEGKGLDALKGMVNDWHSSGSQTETDSVEYEPSDGFPCKVGLLMKWSKPRNPARDKGEIVISVTFSECNCGYRGAYQSDPIANGSVVYRLPVNFVKGPDGAPAWFPDSPHATLTVHSQCCGRRDTTHRTYSHAGTLINTGRTATGGGTTTGPVAPPPPPPPRPPPPPATPTWPSTPEAQLKMCPECAPIARDIELTRAGITQAEAKVAGLARALLENGTNQQSITRRIAALQAEISSQTGTGGTAVDTTTGVTTSAITQADGTVLITVTDSSGAVIDSHTRPRRDLAKARDEMGQLQNQLDGLKNSEASIIKQLAQARAARDGLVADLNRLENSLAACLERCRQRVTGTSVFVVETAHNIIGNNPFDPLNPLGSGAGIGTGTQPSTGCATPRPPDDTQTQSCPAGQSGTIVQTRTYSCAGRSWVPGPFQTTTNSCTTAPPAGCTTPQPPNDTQTLSCPAGQTGSIVQTRSYSCVNRAYVPGPFTTVSNTCVAAPTGCATNFSTGTYSCSGACGINSVGLSVSPGGNSMTASPFGSNSGVSFSCSGPSASSPGGTLTILGLPGHTCTLNALGTTSFGVFCSNTSGGTCNSSCSR